MGYNSNNIVQNLINIIAYLAAAIGLAVFALAIRFLKNKFAVVNRIFTILSRLLFFNLFLRLFLESYMQDTISSILNLTDM